MGVANGTPLFLPYRTVSLFLLFCFTHFTRECCATNVIDSLEQWLHDQLQHHAIPRFLYNDDDYYAGDDYTKTDDNDGSNNNINNRENKLLYTSLVDVSDFALKYTGCQNVQSWASNSNNNNDDGNNNNNNNQYRDSPLTVHRFVTIRLCSASKCSNYNSLGCQSEHAMDFLLPMENYLDLLAAYQSQKMQLYCDVCTACDEFIAPTSAPTAAPTTSTDDVYGNSNYMANSNYYGMDDDDDANRKLADNNDGGYYYGYNKYKDDDYYYASAPWYIADDGQTCKYSKVCENFQSVCKTSPPSFPTSSCKYTASTGTYVGPHCASDGSTIHRGMFHDASCSEYMGAYEGDDDDDATITYNSNQCQDCNAARSYSLVSDDEVSSSASTNPLCGAVFDTAALCNAANVSLPLVTQQTGYYAYTDANVEHYVPSSNQQTNEAAVCTFIEALMGRNYDEGGKIFVQSDFEMQNWRKGSEYLKIARMAGFGQLCGLALSGSVCIAIAVYAAYLHKKLWFSKPWVPPRSVLECTDSVRYEAGRLCRIQSGIGSARSSEDRSSSYEAPTMSLD